MRDCDDDCPHLWESEKPGGGKVGAQRQSGVRADGGGAHLEAGGGGNGAG